ncbi:MAG: sigma 54-interacting transcriptional regulator [Oscillospiraceae bacterium]|jgi:PAS domain S-box-containing protein|nr:sigma 54-interacting transcriptional regulator [Oscillospiraceae bacterium]
MNALSNDPMSIFGKNILQTVIDAIDAIIAVCDADKTVLMINETGRSQLQELADMAPEELLGHYIDEVLEPLIFDGQSIVGLVAKQRRPLQKNVRYKLDSKGLDKTILYSAVPIIENGRLRYIVATGRDMTELIQLEEQLAASEKLNQYYSGMVQRLAEFEKTDSIISSSKKMEDTLKLAMRASKSDASVFITGESGVGKEEIAKCIHRNSDRKDRAFVAVNCAAIPRELIESELFGYVEGAFTGSRKGGKRGLLEEADGGTFFLDEIGELPFEVQGKLLRVLQDGFLRRIGSTKDSGIDVRYISATNLSPAKLLDGSVFRQDLLYRLSVIPIYVTPIRERREDIIPLVEHFLSFYNNKYKRNVQISAAAYNYLCRLPWRGNVRQIKNVVERVVILSEDGPLLREDLLPILKLDIESDCGDSAEAFVKVTGLTTLSKAQEQMERQLIDMALEEYKTIPKAAGALGVPPSTLYRKLRR